MTFLGVGRVEWADGYKVKGREKQDKPAKAVWKKVRKLQGREVYSRTTTILFGAGIVTELSLTWSLLLWDMKCNTSRQCYIISYKLSEVY